MKSKSIPVELFIELKEIVDKKKPMFRARRDNEYHVIIWGKTPKSICNIRDFVFDTKPKARETYTHLKNILGIK